MLARVPGCSMRHRRAWLPDTRFESRATAEGGGAHVTSLACQGCVMSAVSACCPRSSTGKEPAPVVRRSLLCPEPALPGACFARSLLCPLAEGAAACRTTRLARALDELTARAFGPRLRRANRPRAKPPGRRLDLATGRRRRKGTAAPCTLRHTQLGPPSGRRTALTRMLRGMLDGSATTCQRAQQSNQDNCADERDHNAPDQTGATARQE